MLRLIKNSFYLIILVLMSCAEAVDPEYRALISSHRAKLNEEFLNPENSPIDSSKVYSFKGLKFYPPDTKYKVVATLEILNNEQVFELPHSHNRSKPYKKYGILHFEFEGKPYSLEVFEQEVKKPGFENYLLLPFTDETSGADTYGGGRYLDLDKSVTGNKIELDFNLAYNPYCAYSTHYTCPIPPKENHLNFKVEAGMKYNPAEF